MPGILERTALVLLSLPVLMYAAGCLGQTEDFVAMMPMNFQFTGVHVFVKTLGAALLASAVLLHPERTRAAAGVVLAVCMVTLALAIKVSIILGELPPEMHPEVAEHTRRTAMSGTFLDLGITGAALLAVRSTLGARS